MACVKKFNKKKVPVAVVNKFHGISLILRNSVSYSSNFRVSPSSYTALPRGDQYLKTNRQVLHCETFNPPVKECLMREKGQFWQGTASPHGIWEKEVKNTFEMYPFNAVRDFFLWSRSHWYAMEIKKQVISKSSVQFFHYPITVITSNSQSLKTKWFSRALMEEDLHWYWPDVHVNM